MQSEHKHERVRRAVDEAARDEEDQGRRQLNAGLGIAVLALVVLLLLVGIVTGMTGEIAP